EQLRRLPQAAARLPEPGVREPQPADHRLRALRPRLVRLAERIEHPAVRVPTERGLRVRRGPLLTVMIMNPMRQGLWIVVLGLALLAGTPARAVEQVGAVAALEGSA